VLADYVINYVTYVDMSYRLRYIQVCTHIYRLHTWSSEGIARKRNCRYLQNIRTLYVWLVVLNVKSLYSRNFNPGKNMFDSRNSGLKISM